MTVARLEDSRRWTEQTARVLCGVEGADGRHHCSGELAIFWFGTPLLYFGEFTLTDGVWRPPAGKPGRLWSNARLISEANRRRKLTGSSSSIVDLTAGMTIPRAECPRCHTVQDLLDADDLALLAAWR